MNFSLFLLFQSVLLINGRKYNCGKLCFGLESCVKSCKTLGLIAQDQYSKNSRRYVPILNFRSSDLPNGNEFKPSSGDRAQNSAANNKFESPPKCGLRRANEQTRKFPGLDMGRIVGGEDASPHEFPWQISLQMFIAKKGKVEHFCSGAIITDHWILTAAHCLDVLIGKESQVLVKMGSNKVIDNTTPTYKVEKFRIHEGWNKKTQQHDIAVLKVVEKIEPKINQQNQYEVNFICLPERNSDVTGTLTLAGWGQIGIESPQSEFLLKVRVPVFDHKQCGINYAEFVEINDHKLCAGGKGGQDSCMGDSGGPLINDDNGKATIVGVVSFGFPCAVKDMPGVYTKISNYIDWIVANTN